MPEHKGVQLKQRIKKTKNTASIIILVIISIEMLLQITFLVFSSLPSPSFKLRYAIKLFHNTNSVLINMRFCLRSCGITFKNITYIQFAKRFCNLTAARGITTNKTTVRNSVGIGTTTFETPKSNFTVGTKAIRIIKSFTATCTTVYA